MDSAVRNQRAPGDWGQGRGGLGKRHLVNIKQTKARQTSGQLDLTFTYCLLSSAFLLLLFDSTLLCAPFLYFFYFFFSFSKRCSEGKRDNEQLLVGSSKHVTDETRGRFGVGWLAGRVERMGRVEGGRRKVLGSE